MHPHARHDQLDSMLEYRQITNVTFLKLVDP
jgi:hypothetical protein